MFVRLSKIIQNIQRFIYKPTTHAYKMHKINGQSVILQSVLLQKAETMIDLQYPFIKEMNIRFLQHTHCKKYIECYAVRTLEDIKAFQ